MSEDEEVLDNIYQAAFNSVTDTVKEEVGIETNSPHPSIQRFTGENGSVSVQLGEGLIYRYFREEEEKSFKVSKDVSESKFREEVPEHEAKFLIACAEMWQAIGQKQMENLSEEYLEKYM